jgi:hypothetical protein
MIKTYEKFDNRSIVSFDFDGVLHLSTIKGTLDPINYLEWDLLPSENIFEIVWEEYNSGNKIIVVSSRCEISLNIIKNLMWKYINYYNLPIEEIYLTCSRPKKPILKKLKAIRHYDDNFNMRYELDDTDIEFKYVYKDKIIF